MELGRTYVTFQDNLSHVARPLGAEPEFQIFGAEAIMPAGAVVQVQPLKRSESSRFSIPPSSNCPKLDAWGILYIQTTHVLLGA